MTTRSMNQKYTNVDQTITEIEDTAIKHVTESIQWYDKYSKGARVSFRISGASVIILSVTIPVLSQVQANPLVITIFSLTIAAVTSLSSFFSPEKAWKENINAKLGIEHYQKIWHLELLEAKALENKDLALSETIKITKELFVKCRDLTATNTQGFFENVSFPDKN